MYVCMYGVRVFMLSMGAELQPSQLWQILDQLRHIASPGFSVVLKVRQSRKIKKERGKG